MVSILTINLAYSCSVFIKNDSQGNYIFSKSRDVIFLRYDPSYMSSRQQNVTFNAPEGKYKYISLQYSQVLTSPNIFSTGTNQKGITMSYNYDSAQLGSSGDNLAIFLPSIINMANDFNTYLISSVKSLDEANQIIKKAVNDFNNKDNSSLPIALPMLISLAQHKENNKDDFEIVEIVISNPKMIKNTYFNFLKLNNIQGSDILEKEYNQLYTKFIVKFFKNNLGSALILYNLKNQIFSNNDINNLINFYFADQAAKLVAYNNLELQYSVITNPNYVIETNHISSPSLQKFARIAPSDSTSRYKSLCQLLSNSNEIAKYTNDNQGYSRELAIMFLNNTYTVDDRDQTGYSRSEKMAVSREESRSKYVINYIKDEKTGLDTPLVFVEFTSPAQPYNRASIKLDDEFWKDHKDGDIIVDNEQPYFRYQKSIIA